MRREREREHENKLRLLLDYDTGLFAFPIIKINMWTPKVLFCLNCHLYLIVDSILYHYYFLGISI